MTGLTVNGSELSHGITAPPDDVRHHIPHGYDSVSLPLALSRFLSVLPVLLCHIFIALKKTTPLPKKTRKQFFSLYPSLSHSISPSLLLTGLSLPISLYLHLFFLTPIYLLPSFALSFHLIPPFTRIFLASLFPHTHTHTHSQPSVKTGGLAVCLFRPNTYTHQYFSSCYALHIFYATPPSSHSMPSFLFFLSPRSLRLSFSPS